MIWSHCRRNNYQWRLLASIQDRCISCRNSGSSCYFKISVRAFQCGMGYNLRGEYFYITKLSGFFRSFGVEVKSPFLVFFQARHIIFLLCQFVNHLEVIRLPVYYPSQEEKDDPKLYASNVRRLMATEVSKN